MKERPILFSAAMVRALLDGSKTQTRRVVKMPDPYEWGFDKLCTPIEGFNRTHTGRFGALFKAPEYRWIAQDHPFHGFSPCPYGQPGDRLWVREAWRTIKESDDLPPRDLLPSDRIWYEAQEDVPFHPSDFGKLRPSMFMPRWASRITLEVTGVRVERLQDISEADAIAEGAPWILHVPHPPEGGSCKRGFYELWETINGHSSWETNPWVWVVEFKVVKP